MFILFIILCLSIHCEGMDAPISKLPKKYSQHELAKKLKYLESNSDAFILTHLIERKKNTKSFKSMFSTVRNYFAVNKAMCSLRHDTDLVYFLSARISAVHDLPELCLAAEFATPAAREILKKANKENPEQFTDLIKKTVMHPDVSHYLKMLIECDENGLFFQGIPRITPLMIAVGYNNTKAVEILIDAAKKKGILELYINMQCPPGTATHDQAYAPDSEYSFYCVEGTTALHLASFSVYKADISILKRLLHEGALTDRENGRHPTPLFYALVNTQDYSRARLLLDYGADREKVLNDSRATLTDQTKDFLKSYKVKLL